MNKEQLEKVARLLQEVNEDDIDSFLNKKNNDKRNSQIAAEQREMEQLIHDETQAKLRELRVHDGLSRAKVSSDIIAKYRRLGYGQNALTREEFKTKQEEQAAQPTPLEQQREYNKQWARQKMADAMQKLEANKDDYTPKEYERKKASIYQLYSQYLH